LATRDKLYAEITLIIVLGEVKLSWMLLPDWRQENDQNFDETGFVSGVVFPAGIHRRAI
jgi:hypothetical protein